MRVFNVVSAVLVGLTFLAIPAVAGADYESAVVADDPLAYYRLNEASGPVAADSSGNLLPSPGVYALSGVTYSVPGPFPATGSSTAVTLTTGSVTATVPGIAHTASLWVKPSARTSQTFLRHGDPAADGWAIGIAPDSTPRGGKRKLFFQSHGVSVNSKITLSSGVWSMVGVTWDASHIRFYVNGGAITKAISTPGGWTPPGPATNTTLTIGPGTGSGTGFDEVAVFASALSQSQIAAHYAATLLPTIVSAPAIVPLSAVRDGDVLTLTPGTYSGAVGVAEQWQRCDASDVCTDITGATATTYTLTAADLDSTIQVQETATNANGSISTISNPTEPVLARSTSTTTVTSPATTPTTTTPAPATTTLCTTLPRLAYAPARIARIGTVRVTVRLTASKRLVTVRSRFGSLRSVVFRFDGKRVKTLRRGPFNLTVRRAWMKVGRHTLRATVRTRTGTSRTITMRLTVKAC